MNRLFQLLIKACIFLNAPHFLFWLAKIKLKNNQNSSKKRNILALNRSIFNRDIEALSASEYFSIFPLDKIFFTFQLKHCSSELSVSHNNFYEARRHVPVKKYEKYQRFLAKFLSLLFNHYKIDALLTANFNYSWQQEIFAIAERFGVKRIVLYKEGINPVVTADMTKSPHSVMLSYYKNSFLNVDLILVYNEQMKKAFEENFDLKELKVSLCVIGIPRLIDFCDMAPNKRKKIVFFSFDVLEKFRHLNLDREQVAYFEQKTQMFCDVFSDFVVQNQNIPVVIKTKSNSKFLEIAKKRFPKLINVPNVHFTNEGNSIELIKESNLVIGFNSTTLIEAILAKRPIISFRLPDDSVRCMFFNCGFYDEVCPPLDKIQENIKQKLNSSDASKFEISDHWLKSKVGYTGEEVLARFEKSVLSLIS